VTILETWPQTLDPIQIALGICGIAALVVGLVFRTRDGRQQLGRRALLAGFGLLGVALLYSLVLTWTTPFPSQPIPT
jgi:multisubunit Na+/H+ antiporter MnhB subunit